MDRRSACRRAAAQGVVLALGVGLVLHRLHAGEHEAADLPGAVHWLRDSFLAAPAAASVCMLATSFARALSRSLGPVATRGAWATAVGIGYALTLIPGGLVHARLFGAEHAHGDPLVHASADAAASAPFAVALAALAVCLLGVPGSVAPAGRGLTHRRDDLQDRWAGGPDGAHRTYGRIAARVVVSASIVAIVALSLPAAPWTPVDRAEASHEAPVDECTSTSVDRTYDVAAVNVLIPFNRWADVNRHGQMFVLQQDKDAARYWHYPLGTTADGSPGEDVAGDRRLRPRPLVLRANEGECVRVDFTNELHKAAPVLPSDPLAKAAAPNPPLSGTNEGLPTVDQFASMHVHGASFNVQTSDGGNVGFNADTTVGTGKSISYFWRAPSVEGLYFFHDHATISGSEADGGSNAHGLFGGLAVEPAGSRWFDPVTGAELSGAEPYTNEVIARTSGELYLDAIIVPPAAQDGGSFAPHDGKLTDLHVRGGVAFREMIQLSQDEIPGDHLQNCDFKVAAGLISTRSECVNADPATVGGQTVGLDFGIGLGFNYGVEPLLARQEPINRCPDCVGEETWLSSWPYGDPGLVKLASGLGPWYPAWHPWFRDADGALVNVGGDGNPIQAPGAVGEPEDCGLPGTSVDRDFDGVADEEVPTSCWTSSVIHAYQYDATKVRFAHAGPKETHVFHMHAHQWLQDPHDVGASGHTPGQPGLNSPTTERPQATTIDSQTFGPGESFTNDVLFCAGSRPGTVGDAIFHCHLYPHFAEGFWALWRVHDVGEDGRGHTPDGIGVKNLLPLPDRIAALDEPPAATSTNPGFPRFLPGQFGWRAPQPINGVSSPNGSADDPATSLLREDLDFDTRMVAGQALDLDYLHQVQEIDYGAATGDFTLTYRGETTALIDPDADALALEAALEALATIAEVDVGGDPGGPWTVTFLDPSKNVVALTSDSAGVVITQDLTGNPIAGQLATEDANTGGAGGTVTDRTGDAVRPGAAWVDPCPAGARTLTYNVSIIQLDVTYNEDGWHDPQARVLVLDKDVDAVLSGAKEPEPLFFRANVGDCVNWNLTNRLPNWIGNDDFLELVQTNMVGQHIHLVKFDVLSSDGSSNGWNYQEAAFSQDQMTFDDQIKGGALDCGADTFDGPHLVEEGCRIPHATGAGFDPAWSCDSLATCPHGQTIHERWYVDYELRTVFTHDHHFPAEDQNRGYFAAMLAESADMDFRDPFDGEFFQPITDPAHGPTCASFLPSPDEKARFQGDGQGPACEADAVGTQVDVIGPGSADDFREFGLGMQDFVSLYRPCTTCGPSVIGGEEPVNPPAAPELYPDDDPGVFGFNYKNAPFQLRDTVGGLPVDPAYVFSSTVHGDPRTPVFRAYAGDPIRMRLIQGAQEEQHVVQVHGMRWRDEPDDPGSPLVNSRSIGVSDAFNFEVPQMQCGVGQDCVGDYLYSGTSTDDMWLGAWGIIRVFGKGVQGLLPLPDNVPRAQNGNTRTNATGAPPPPAHDAGNPCPEGAPVRSFEVIGVDATVTYNEFGDHDPFGLVYAVQLPGETPADAASRVRSSNPSPMVLHATEGDCVEVTLTNVIDPAGAFATQHAPAGARTVGADLADEGLHGFDPPLPLEATDPASGGTPAGLRISLHAGLLQYDVRGSDGAVIGFNRDQTVGPGESISYRWWADDVTPGELGAINLTDYGDVRGHRHHGLFAGLEVHPAGASFHDPLTGVSLIAGSVAAAADAAAVITASGVSAPEELEASDLDEWQAHVDEANRLASGEEADVRLPTAGDYRNWTIFFQDGLNLWDASGANMPDQFDHPPTPEEPAGALPDAEDRGEKGFNYRNASFHNRFGQAPGEAHDALDGTIHRDVFSSRVHGDPSTPVFRAYAGDDLRVRVLQGADKPRQHSFQMSGHVWQRQPFDDAADTELTGTSGGFSVGRALNLHVVAGGDSQLVGDHRYGCAVLSHHQSGGLWGIGRIYSPPVLTGPSPFAPDALRASDDPHDPEYQPIMPLEVVEITARAWDDGNANGVRDEGEPPLGRSIHGAPVLEAIHVELYEPGPDGQAGTTDDVAVDGPLPTHADGTVRFQVPAGNVYAVRGLTPPDWAPTNGGWFPVAATSQAESPAGDLGFVQFGDAEVALFEDANGDNVFDGEFDAWASGQAVTIKGRGGTYEATTSAAGTAFLENVLPGSYDVSVTPWDGRTPSADPPYVLEVGENGVTNVEMGFTRTAGLKVKLFSDADADRTQGIVGGMPEQGIAGWDVQLWNEAGTEILQTSMTDPTGIADFGVIDAGTYRIRPIRNAPDWSVTSVGSSSTGFVPAPHTSCVGGCEFVETEVWEQTSHLATIALHNQNVWVSASLYNDVDNDGVRDGGEKKLVAWDAELWGPSGKIADAVVGNDGVVTFYTDPGPTAGPHGYQIRLRQPDTSPAAIPWRPTPGASRSGPTAKEWVTKDISVLAGHDGRVSSGFVQLGTIAAHVWHDLDADGSNDGDEPALAGRMTRLLSRNGKTVLAQKATDTGGVASFEVAPATEYQLQVQVPGGWVATYPTAPNGLATDRAKLTSDPDPQKSKSEDFGQHQINDITPPPTPVANPGGGDYDAVQDVTLTSESGADIYYTTDGTAPSPSSGQLYSGPITIAVTTTLQAVARDAAGNLSGIMTQDYVIQPAGPGGGGGGSTQVVVPTSWTLTKGLLISGSVPGDIASDNGTYLAVGSVKQGKKQVISSSGSATVAPGASVTGITLDGHASRGGVERRLALWNFTTGRWDDVDRRNEVSSDSGPVTYVVSGAYVSAGGEIRVRLDTSAQNGHEYRIDRLTFDVRS